MTSKSNGISRVKEREPRHQCLIYEGPPSKQLPALATMIKRKLDEGYRCLYLNSRPMVAGVQSSIARIGIDVVSEIAKGRLILSSEPTTIADGGFDVGLMLQSLEDALDRAIKDGYKGLWATGDMTWEFGSEKNFAKLMEYENQLEELFSRRQELCGICQYHLDTLPRQAAREGLAAHQMIFINETLSRMNPHYAPSGTSGERLAVKPGLDGMITELCRMQGSRL